MRRRSGLKAANAAEMTAAFEICSRTAISGHKVLRRCLAPFGARLGLAIIIGLVGFLLILPAAPAKASWVGEGPERDEAIDWVKDNEPALLDFVNLLRGTPQIYSLLPHPKGERGLNGFWQSINHIDIASRAGRRKEAKTLEGILEACNISADRLAAIEGAIRSLDLAGAGLYQESAVIMSANRDPMIQVVYIFRTQEYISEDLGAEQIFGNWYLANLP